jgi:hypothetical protein
VSSFQLRAGALFEEVAELGHEVLDVGLPWEEALKGITLYLFVNGRLTSTDNRHQRLYQQYRARPKSGAAVARSEKR